MCRIQWCCSFVSKPFIYEEIEPHNIAKFWNLKYRKIFWPSLRLLNQVDRSYTLLIFWCSKEGTKQVAGNHFLPTSKILSTVSFDELLSFSKRTKKKNKWWTSHFRKIDVDIFSLGRKIFPATYLPGKFEKKKKKKLLLLLMRSNKYSTNSHTKTKAVQNAKMIAVCSTAWPLSSVMILVKLSCFSEKFGNLKLAE